MVCLPPDLQLYILLTLSFRKFSDRSGNEVNIFLNVDFIVLNKSDFSRFVLADTEKLHDKINAMSDRIRQLEDALTVLQSTVSREPHPLLQKDLLQIKSIIELHGAFSGDSGKVKTEKQEEDVDNESQYIDAFGTMAIREDGATTFYGRSAGSEVSEIISTCCDADIYQYYFRVSSW